jgi:Flp pilus assembly pilin Flp
MRTAGHRIRSRAGQAMIEYVLLLALVATGLTAILVVLRDSAGRTYSNEAGQIARATTLCPFDTQTGGSGQNSNGSGGNCQGSGGGGGLIGGVAGGGGVGGGSSGTVVPGGGGGSGGPPTGGRPGG